MDRSPRDRMNGLKPLDLRGFTLVELMVGIVVGTIVLTGVMSSYQTLTRASKLQGQFASMMQNLRGSIFAIENDARMAGYDPRESGDFGILDISRYTTPDDFVPAALDANGSPVMTAAQDTDEDGAVDAGERRTFLLYDDGNDNVFDLGVEENGIPATRELIAEGIQAIGFAYAYDADGDGELEISPGNGNVIWAVDTDQDNVLDTLLDSNDDGRIDEADETGAGTIGIPLATPVPLSAIRMVRIWLLAQTTERAPTCVEANTPPRYVVADRIITDPGDCFRRRTLVQTVECKNMGL